MNRFRSVTLCDVVSILIQPNVSVTPWTLESLDFGSALSPTPEPSARLLHSQWGLVGVVGIKLPESGSCERFKLSYLHAVIYFKITKVVCGSLQMDLLNLSPRAAVLDRKRNRTLRRTWLSRRTLDRIARFAQRSRLSLP